MIDANRLDRSQVAVLIPALNESLRIRDVAQSALAFSPNVIVVDDGSSDGTAECVADLPVILLRHAQRRGKGECLRHGFREALQRGFLGVLTMDGDGQHSADDLPRLLDSANRHPGLIVVGARLRKRNQQPKLRRLANESGDWAVAWGTGYRLCDSQSGQRFYPAQVMALPNVPGDNFAFEAQILISAARALGTRAVSVPIESRYRCADRDEAFRPSHFRPLVDVFRIAHHIASQVLGYGNLARVRQSIRNNPPLIDDASGEFGATQAAQPVREIA